MTAINEDFRLLAMTLFHSDLIHSDNLVEARRLVNEDARHAIDKLYAMLGGLDTMPEAIRVVLHRHRTYVAERLSGAGVPSASGIVLA